jgi:mono/diheme cytochrome c family protein
MNSLAATCASALIAAALTLIGVAAGDSPEEEEDTGMLNPAALNTVSGAEIYRQICQGCHMPDGRGAVGAGRYPSLANNPTLSSPQYMAVTILEGRRNMPGFGAHDGGSVFFSPPSLTDEQVAAVIDYVRTHFGNRYTDAISAVQVERMRHSR